MSQYRLIIDEKDYCDESDLLISQYNQSASLHFQSQIQFINKWIISDTNAPLVVVGDPESGKKTLLCQFLKVSKETHKNWLHLCHFSSITPQYSHILYKVMIELRNYYKIEQRVDLNDEKLRRYLKYWLEVVSQLIDKEYLGYSKSQIPKVVIIIEGIDQCLDTKGNIVDIQFWLPSEIPSNIKLILTANAIKEEELPKATVLQHHLSQEKKLKIISQYQQKAKSLFSNKLSLYHIQIIDKMLKIKPNFACESQDIQKIVNEYIQAVSTTTFSTQQIKSILYILTLTRKGLKQKWIQKIVNITSQKYGLFLRYFSFFIVQSKTYYIICNKSAKSIIRNLVDHSGEKEKTYRHSISYFIRNEAVHLRELEEIVHQLYLSESYNQLKEVISCVQNFTMLYTPLSKDLLCKCWVKLEQLQQYDPVFQYNKAIQAYKSHYYPKQQDLYKIIFQISMFFKEYAEFENARTPQFRHPLIKGEIDQLVQIGIYEQLKSLAMIGRCKVYKLKPLEKFTKTKTDNTSSKQQKKDKQKEQPLQKEEKIRMKSKAKVNKKEGESEITVDLSRPQTSSSKQQPFPVETTLNIEQLNVSIYANQQKFRAFFTKSMKEYLQNNFTPLKKNGHKQKQLSFESQQSDNEEQQIKQKQYRQPRIDIQKLKESLILKKFREYLQENYHKTGEQVRFYYYKQWIWLQFPWICQTVKNIYSQMIKQCLPGSIHFMSPLQEFHLVREVLKIARTAKESKLNIFTDKKIEVLPLRYSPHKLEQIQSQVKLKYTDSALTHSSKTKRVEELQQTKLGLNLQTIDDMIFKERQFQQNFKDTNKGLSKNFRDSVPNLNMFVTQTSQKAKMLPFLSKSKFVKETRRNNREKQNTNQSKDLTTTVRKYNEIKHENDMLIQKIQEMKRLSSIQISKTKEQQQEIMSHIKNIEQKKEGLQKHYNHQYLLQKKLQLIIKICDLNKMYGSQSEYLSTYLNSLKQMILLQENRVKEIKGKICDFLSQSKTEVKRLKAKRKELKSIKDQHDKIYVNLGTDSTNPQYVSMPLQQIEQELREMEKTVKTKSKKEKSKMEHFLSSEDYEILEEKLGIVYGESNDEKLKEFIDKQQKKKQLHLRNGQLKSQINKYKQQIESLKVNLQNLKQIGLNEKRFNIANTLIDTKKLLSDIRNRNSLLTQAIETITSKA